MSFRKFLTEGKTKPVSYEKNSFEDDGFKVLLVNFKSGNSWSLTLMDGEFELTDVEAGNSETFDDEQYYMDTTVKKSFEKLYNDKKTKETF